ncbi:MAG: hypothetical protein MHM6MM_001298 [Cercozoa sp. M6MM]
MNAFIVDAGARCSRVTFLLSNEPVWHKRIPSYKIAVRVPPVRRASHSLKHRYTTRLQSEADCEKVAETGARDQDGPSAASESLSLGKPVSLCNDLLHSVFSFACSDVRDAARLASVCKPWNRALRSHQVLWKHLVMQQWPHTQEKKDVDWFSLFAVRAMAGSHATVSIENCDFGMLTRQSSSSGEWRDHATFRFQCPLRVDGPLMRRTDKVDVDHCLVCQRDVHIVDAVPDLLRVVDSGECVRFAADEKGKIVEYRKGAGELRLMAGLMMQNTRLFGEQALAKQFGLHSPKWPLLFGNKFADADMWGYLVMMPFNAYGVRDENLLFEESQHNVFLTIRKTPTRQEATNMCELFFDFEAPSISLLHEAACVRSLYESEKSKDADETDVQTVVLSMSASHTTATLLVDTNIDTDTDTDNSSVYVTHITPDCKGICVSGDVVGDDICQWLQRRASLVKMPKRRNVSEGDISKPALPAQVILSDERHRSGFGIVAHKLVHTCASRDEFDRVMEQTNTNLRADTMLCAELPVFENFNDLFEEGGTFSVSLKEAAFAGECRFQRLLACSTVPELLESLLQEARNRGASVSTKLCVLVEGAYASDGFCERLQHELQQLLPEVHHWSVHNMGVDAVHQGAVQLASASPERQRRHVLVTVRSSTGEQAGQSLDDAVCALTHAKPRH